MTAVKSTFAFAAALLHLTLLASMPAHAQFGHFSYPKDDFKWYWGDQRELSRRGFEDFSMIGYDGGFRCTLSGSLGPGSRLTGNEVRQIENDLSTSSFFIENVANTMYVLDQRREIDWAELDCIKPVVDESAADLQDREDKARAKAERDREKRRERQQREEARASF
jgi:hypothetical protein